MLFSANATASNEQITLNKNEICLFYQISETCNRPDCFCFTRQITGLPVKYQQQIVYILFDDDATLRNNRLYEQIVNLKSTNPNGCPITRRIFMSQENIDNYLVEKVYILGHEIAVPRYNYIYSAKTKTGLEFEVVHQQHTISQLTNITLSKIFGFQAQYRGLNNSSPDKVLLNNVFKYDSSYRVIFKTQKIPSIFLFNLDYYSWPYQCSVSNCPSGHFCTCLWKFPARSLLNKLTKYLCICVNDYLKVLQKEADAIKYFWRNFNRYYTKNRALPKLNIHLAWLFFAYERKDQFRLRALECFGDNILSLVDVYVVNMKNTMHWMEPRTFHNEIESFTNWQCENRKRRDSDEGKTIFHISTGITRPDLISPTRNLYSIDNCFNNSLVKSDQNSITVYNQKSQYEDNSNAPTRYFNISPGKKSLINSHQSHFLNCISGFGNCTSSAVLYTKRDHLSFGISNYEKMTTNYMSILLLHDKISFNKIYLVDVKHTTTKSFNDRKIEKPLYFSFSVKNTNVSAKPSVYLSSYEEYETNITMNRSKNVSPILLENNTFFYKNSAKSKNFNDRIETISEPMVRWIQNSHNFINDNSNNSKQRKNESQESVPVIDYLEKNSLIQNKKNRRSTDFGSGNSSRKNSFHVARVLRRIHEIISLAESGLSSLSEGAKLCNSKNACENLETMSTLIISPTKISSTASKNSIQMINSKHFLTLQKVGLTADKKLTYHNKTKAKNSYHQIVKDEDKRIKSDIFHPMNFSDNLIDSNEFRTANDSNRNNHVSEHHTNVFRFLESSHLKGLDISGYEKENWIVKASRREKNNRNYSNKPTNFSPRNVFLKNNDSHTFTGETFINNKIIVNQHDIQNNISNESISIAENNTYNQRDLLKKERSYNKGDTTKNISSHNKNEFFDYYNLDLQNLPHNNDSIPKYITNQYGKNGNISGSWNVIDKCFQGVNCKHPNCWCMNSKPDLNLKEIPHLIYVTFSGVVSEIMRQQIDLLFSNDRTNPNGCNIRSTVFVTSQKSSYGAIHWLHRRGHEIALNGLTDDDLDPDLRHLQIPIQKRLLKDYAGIPEIDIRGWRNPNLSFEGGEHLKYIQQYNLDYDATLRLIGTQHEITGHWPFTLDFGCSPRDPCQKKNYPGLWEVPITPFIGMNANYRCLYVNNCSFKPVSALEMYYFLVSNFWRAYTEKKPLGINLRSEWFQENQKENFQGLEAFINLLVDLPDVYIIRISDLIHWIQYPRPIRFGFSLHGLGC